MLFLLGRERVKFAFSVRYLAVGVEFVHAFVAGVGQQFDARRQRQPRVFEQSEVVRFTARHLHAQNLLGALVDHELRLLGVALLLARVEPLLFFWGRSMRCSLASTTTTCKFNPPSCNTFLPGR